MTTTLKKINGFCKDTFLKGKDMLLSEQHDSECDGMNFQDFLNFLEFVQKKANVKETVVFNDFFELISDLRRCSISGSAILNLRLGIDSTAGDIDLFIEDNPKNMSILDEFFNVCSSEVFRAYSNKYIDDVIYSGGNWIYSAGDKSYSMIKLDYAITPLRFSFGNSSNREFNLNIIMVKPLDANERKQSRMQISNNRGPYDRYMRRRGKNYNSVILNLRGIETSSDELNMMNDHYPVATPLHMIESSFDFEELKYVYSFELQQPVTTTIVGKMLLLNYSKKITELKDSNDISEDINREVQLKITKAVTAMDEDNANYLKKFNNSEIMTFSKGMFFENDFENLVAITSMHYDGFSLTDTFSDISITKLANLFKSAITILGYIEKRVSKYEEKNFKIKDPHMVIATLQSFIGLYNNWTMSRRSLNKIALESTLLKSTRDSLYKTKYLRHLNVQTKDILEQSSLRLEASPRVRHVLEL